MAVYLCHGCLNQIDDLNGKIYLFDNFKEQHLQPPEFTTIYDMFSKYTSVEVDKSDEFLAYICSECYSKLENFHRFRTICIASHLELIERKPIILFEDQNQGNEFIDAPVKEEAHETEHYSEHHSFADSIHENSVDYITDVQLKTEVDGTEEVRTDDVSVTWNKKKRKNSRDKVKKSTNKISNPDIEKQAGFKCTICAKTFVKQHRYEAHIRVHQGLKAFPCHECDKAFCKLISLKRHKQQQHSSDGMSKVEFICGVNDCGKSYALKVCTT